MHLDQFHLHLISLTGKIIPMSLTESLAMVKQVFEASNILNPMDISDANIIDCFKKWVKLVKPNRKTVASAVDSLMSRWTTAMIGEIRDPGTNVFKKDP